MLPKWSQCHIGVQHVSIIQHPKTPRSKNGRTGTLEGRSGTSIYPAGTLGSAQLLLTRTQTHTRIRALALAQTVFHTVSPLPKPFFKPYAQNSHRPGRTVPFPDERYIFWTNGHCGTATALFTHSRLLSGRTHTVFTPLPLPTPFFAPLPLPTPSRTNGTYSGRMGLSSRATRRICDAQPLLTHTPSHTEIRLRTMILNRMPVLAPCPTPLPSTYTVPDERYQFWTNGHVGLRPTPPLSQPIVIGSALTLSCTHRVALSNQGVMDFRRLYVDNLYFQQYRSARRC